MRNQLKQYLIDQVTDNQYCLGQIMINHVCDDQLHMNEVLFPRNIFQKLPKKLQEYFWHEINCHLCCGTFHFNHGHSRAWREFFHEYQCLRYGDDVVDEYERNAPLKIRRRK